MEGQLSELKTEVAAMKIEIDLLDTAIDKLKSIISGIALDIQTEGTVNAILIINELDDI